MHMIPTRAATGVAFVAPTAAELAAIAQLRIEADLQARANAEVLALRQAGHVANPRRCIHGVEIEIIRYGRERSFSIITPRASK